MMGWMWPFDANKQSLISMLTEESQVARPGCIITTKCLRHCYRGNRFSGVLWAVWERAYAYSDGRTQDKDRFIVCNIMRGTKEGWGYKDVEEACGPYHVSCPISYLDMVPLERFGGDAEWRERVRAAHRRSVEKQRAKRKAKADVACVQ